MARTEFAVQIVDTPEVISVMCAILLDIDDRISADSRSAIVEAFVSTSRRSCIRRVIKQHGCDEKISIASRLATPSGDYSEGSKALGLLLVTQRADPCQLVRRPCSS